MMTPSATKDQVTRARLDSDHRSSPIRGYRSIGARSRSIDRRGWMCLESSGELGRASRGLIIDPSCDAREAERAGAEYSRASIDSPRVMGSIRTSRGAKSSGPATAFRRSSRSSSK